VTYLTDQILTMCSTPPTEVDLSGVAAQRLLTVDSVASGWLESLEQDRGDSISADLVKHILHDIRARARGLDLAPKPERVVL